MTLSPDASSPAPLVSHPVGKLGGSARVPGDKSISHRALMLASQALGVTEISGLLEGEDVLATAGALRALGVELRKRRDGVWEVEGRGVGGLHAPASVLDMGNAGTAARLMMGLLAPYPFLSIFTGDASLCARPMGRVMTPLAEFGATFMARDDRFLPLAMQGTDEPLPVTYRLPVASAQVKSAVLLAGLNTPGITTVIEAEPTRDHTERMLAWYGFDITCEQKDGVNHIAVRGQKDVAFAKRLLGVPADPSSAAFPMVAALLLEGSEIVLEQVCINPLRTGLFQTLKEMGASIEYLGEREEAGEPVADIRVRAGHLRGIDVPAERAPSMIDEYPVLAVAAAFAEGNTVMRGLGELRVKESDRLQAIIDGLAACGVNTSVTGDDLTVHGTGGLVEGGGRIEARHDHRIAMSFLVLGMAAQHAVTIDDARAIATSFPGFSGLMNALGGRIEDAPLTSALRLPMRVIAIDGPAASGKGTLAQRLARYFGFHYLDTGSLYRAVGLRLLETGQAAENKNAAISAAKNLRDQDLQDSRLRNEKVGRMASIVSAYPEVRSALLDYQRAFAARPEGAVLDGRDIGTVVCPDAAIKLFLTATLEARAARRHHELQEQGIEVVYDSILRELRERDARDSGRSAAPLVPAPDALLLDTTDMDADTVFHKVVALVGQRIDGQLLVSIGE